MDYQSLLAIEQHLLIRIRNCFRWYCTCIRYYRESLKRFDYLSALADLQGAYAVIECVRELCSIGSSLECPLILKYQEKIFNYCHYGRISVLQKERSIHDKIKF